MIEESKTNRRQLRRPSFNRKEKSNLIPKACGNRIIDCAWGSPRRYTLPEKICRSRSIIKFPDGASFVSLTVEASLKTRGENIYGLFYLRDCSFLEVYHQTKKLIGWTKRQNRSYLQRENVVMFVKILVYRLPFFVPLLRSTFSTYSSFVSHRSAAKITRTLLFLQSCTNGQSRKSGWTSSAVPPFIGAMHFWCRADPDHENTGKSSMQAHPN